MLNRIRIGAIALSMVAVLPAIARDTSQWSNLQSLRRGDRIGVVQANQTRIEGRFESADGSSITILAGNATTLAKEDVVQVYRRPRLSRVKRALIGAAAGAAAGAILDLTLGARLNNEGWFGDWGGAANAASVAAGAGIGAGIGALTGGGYKTIYQRDRKSVV